MFKRILIANRGEIARRIARTCRKLGIEYVAVYSDADAQSPHLEGAVEAVHIGASPATHSYLNIDRIVNAARSTGCDGVHPGYGFLSENAEFATAVRTAGIVFIGPNPDTITSLGDKARARALMAAAGVPIVPGSAEASDDPAALVDMVVKVGLPVILKPSAGGGGKGMKVITSLDGLKEEIESAIRVAKNSFGNGQLVVERFVDRPRHIEVQIFGDSHGNAVHLFERECSLQRRHQKVVEEAPAANLPDDVRQRLLNAAVDGARSIGYVNAGTFEFILDQSNQFYFLEVNTRLQVEHPVTEEITGLDLVEWQLRIASGEQIPLSQSEIRQSGHAIECRIYAEDPADEFRPAPGIAHLVQWPDAIRVEPGIVSGGEVPPHYDPIIGKLVSHAADRKTAIDDMLRALDETLLLGLTSNLGYLRRVLTDDTVRTGKVHTKFLDEVGEVFTRAEPVSAAVACASAIEFSLAGDATKWLQSSQAGGLDRTALDNEAPFGRIHVWHGQQVHSAAVRKVGPACLDVEVEAQAYRPVWHREGTALWSGSLGGLPWAALMNAGTLELQVRGDRTALQLMQCRTISDENANGGATAPMPGVVAKVTVSVGDTVEPGTVLAIIEAMKMEHTVVSSVAGTVRSVPFQAGNTVKAGEVLVEIDAAA